MNETDGMGGAGRQVALGRGHYGTQSHNARGSYAYYLVGYDGNPVTVIRSRRRKPLHAMWRPKDLVYGLPLPDGKDKKAVMYLSDDVVGLSRNGRADQSLPPEREAHTSAPCRARSPQRT